MKPKFRLNRAYWMLIFIVAIPFILVPASFASSGEEYREHAPHEHGHGAIDIVMEAEEVVIEIRIPAVNVVGFEHAPRDDEEHEAIRHALVPFEDASSAFVLSGEAGCEVENIRASIASMTHESERHQDEAGNGHEQHGHDTHGHEEHEEQADEEDHSELHATYHLHCHVPGQLRQVDMRVLKHLHDIEEIDVRLVTPDAQRALTLHAGKTVIELAP